MTLRIHKISKKALLVFCTGLSVGLLQAQSGESEWTDTQFPTYIKRLNHFGQRPDWSHDGKKILFVERSFGDVYEMDVATQDIKPLTHHYYHGVYPEQRRYWEIWVADLDYASGEPRIKNQKVVMDNSKGEVKDAVLEPQNFRPGNEEELIVQSNHDGTEVMGLNLQTSEVINYAKSPDSYDEPEGIYPDGQYTLVESNRHRVPGSNLELYKLKLDGSNTWERVTYFNANKKFKATNPVVSDDRKLIAFQVPRLDEVAGIGHGIYLLDIEKYEEAKQDTIKK